MIRMAKKVLVVALLAGLPGLGGTAYGQEGGGLLGGSRQPQAAPERSYEGDPGVTKSAPTQWFKEHFDKLDNSMRKFNQLGSVLGSASDELAADFNKYLDNPSDDLLASKIEKKMAIFADQAVQEFEYVIADRDMIIANFKELTLKLDQFDDQIEDKLRVYDKKLGDMRGLVAEEEQTLIGLAIKIKEAYEEGPKKAAQKEFARQYRRYRLKARYVRGLERNLHNYQLLVKNLQALTGLFSQLQDKFAALMEHLENEKDYLVDAIELQAESVKIKKIMSEGILHGERSIKNVTERLAMLYARVDAFTAVHDKLNMGLGGFADMEETLKGLSSQIDKIGEGGESTADMPADLEDAVDHFFQKRDEYRPADKDR